MIFSYLNFFCKQTTTTFFERNAQWLKEEIFEKHYEATTQTFKI